MPNLVIIDDKERQRIRDALRQYKRLHGNIGDPKLRDRMMAMLGLYDSQLSLSTLQRFLSGANQTDDFMVRRYQKFVDLVAPLSYVDELGTAIDNQLLYPVNAPRPDVTPLEGRYELKINTDGADGAAEETERGLILTPTRNPVFLKSVHFHYRPPYEGEGDEPVIEFGGFGAFVPCGIGQFLLSTAGFANASFALVTQTKADPVELAGSLISTTNQGGTPGSPYQIVLTRVTGGKESA